MAKYSRHIITAALFIFAAFCLFFFELRPAKLLSDGVANVLLGSVISRLSLSVLFVWLLYINGGIYYLHVKKTFFRDMLWCLPCFLVAVVNFPFSALMSGTLVINRMDLMPLYIIYVILIALLEEFIFRGFVITLLYNFFKFKKYPYLLTTVVASLFFSLAHLTNLLVGADIVSVLLQIVYSFLIGAMLTVVLFKTRNIWMCVLIHALFNFGGLLTSFIAIGNPWDLVFWILTIVCGVLCAGHIIMALIKLEKEKDYVS